jgi:hypothetical protein
MPKFWRKREALLKVETTYGTDASPTGSSNAILISDATVQVEADTVDRELVRGTLGQIGSLRVKPRARLTGAVELAGAGAAGTAPKWGPICRACGMSETINAGTDVRYKPVSSAHESVSIYWFADGIRHRILGARGTARMRLLANEVPRLEFDLTGLYEAPTDVALPGGTYTGWSTPRPPGKTATPTYTLHGLAAVSRGIELDLGNQVVHRHEIGAEDVLITGREPTATTRIEAVPVATKNWLAIADAHTLGSLSLVHGTAAGNIVELSAANVQVLDAVYEELDSIAYHRLELAFRESSGDDDLTLIVR